MTALALVIDQGGHSSRALVFDDAGAVVAAASAPVSSTQPAPAQVEQSPAEILASVRTVLARVAEQLGARAVELQSVALIVQRSSLLAWDRTSGAPLSAVLSWQDTRHAAWLEQVVAGRREALREITGLYPNAHYGASKMRWLLDHMPALQHSASSGTLCMAPLASWLQQQLTGSHAPVVDAVIASRTLLTEVGATSWSQTLLDTFAIPAAVLPGVMPTLADYGTLRFGEHSVPLRLLGGDQSFFALSHGSVFAGDTLFINAGTGAFVQQLMSPDRMPLRLLCAPLVIGERPSASVFVAEGTVNAAATALDWWQQQAGSVFTAGEWQQAAALADREPASVPLFCNRITATGSPDWLPAGEPAFSCPASIPLQGIAVLESVVFALQRNSDSLVAVQPANRIVLSGGLSQLALFCQRLADLSGLPVWRSDDVEACARGAAMQLLPAAVGQQRYHEFTPRPSAALQQRYRQWAAMMDQLSAAG